MEELKYCNLDDYTGMGFYCVQGTTSNSMAYNDTLTVLPVMDVGLPFYVVEPKRKFLIKVSRERAALAFYLMMQAGEVKCERDNKFEIGKDLLEVLDNNSIPYEEIS